jgi:hypothetical protein
MVYSVRDGIEQVKEVDDHSPLLSLGCTLFSVGYPKPGSFWLPDPINWVSEFSFPRNQQSGGLEVEGGENSAILRPRASQS